MWALGRVALLALVLAISPLGMSLPAAGADYVLLSVVCGGPVKVVQQTPWGDRGGVACSLMYGTASTLTVSGSLATTAEMWLPAEPGPWSLKPTTFAFARPVPMTVGEQIYFQFYGEHPCLTGMLVSDSGGMFLRDSICALPVVFELRPATPAEQTQQTIDLISGTTTALPAGTQSSLLSTLSAAQTSLGSGSTTAACGQLTSFTNKVKAQSGKSIESGLAAQLTSAAQQIKSSAGCQ